MAVDVAILGATGSVGQKAIALLYGASDFKVVELVASESRVGQRFGEACTWREPLVTLPEEIASLRLCAIEDIRARYVISCLPSSSAQHIEPLLAERGKDVFSNASAHRMKADVPLLVPEINLDHLSLIHEQRSRGKIITNPNCSTVGVALALAPLMKIGQIQHTSVVTLQSISGAGYPGVPSYDMIANSVPHIEGEVEKITEETKKILGTLEQSASFALTAHVHRVPVLFGHTLTLHLSFKEPVSISDAYSSYAAWNEQHPGLFVLHQAKDRPQSLLDLRPDDMRVHIGGLREGDAPHLLGLVVLIHNLVRGAAGAAIANLRSFLHCGMNP